MKNYICEGRKVNSVAAAILTSGQLYLVGELVAIANTNAAIGQEVVGDVEGVFLVPKKAVDVVVQGAALYFDPALNHLTITPGALKKAGYAYEAAGAAVTEVAVKLGR